MRSRRYLDGDCDYDQQEPFVEKIDEPPSCPCKSVVVGRDSRGNWVAQEATGLFGGLFVSRVQAVKYALVENGHHPETIVLTSDIVELDMHRRAKAPQTIADGIRLSRSHAA
jgi:hypothetical protein